LFDGIEIFPQSDPLSIKLGGFVRGAGHGATFQDKYSKIIGMFPPPLFQ
jgi:hypothetical protein